MTTMEAERNTDMALAPVDRRDGEAGEIIEKLVLGGDLARLAPVERVRYYRMFCERLGLDPLTQPFKMLNLSGKLVLYCDRSGAAQLNHKHQVSHQIVAREIIQDPAGECYVVTARASMPGGRQEESIGAVPLYRAAGDGKTSRALFGEDRANALMKAETKAKRRSTLDLLGLGVLDETEIGTIHNAQTVPLESSGATPHQLRAPAKVAGPPQPEGPTPHQKIRALCEQYKISETAVVNFLAFKGLDVGSIDELSATDAARVVKNWAQVKEYADGQGA